MEQVTPLSPEVPNISNTPLSFRLPKVDHSTKSDLYRKASSIPFSTRSYVNYSVHFPQHSFALVRALVPKCDLGNMGAMLMLSPALGMELESASEVQRQQEGRHISQKRSRCQQSPL